MENLDSLQDTYAGSGVGRPRYFRMPELVECPGCDSNTLVSNTVVESQISWFFFLLLANYSLSYAFKG
jgi:hypothetical protein